MPYTHSLVCWRTEPPPVGSVKQRSSSAGRDWSRSFGSLPRRNTYLCKNRVCVVSGPASSSDSTSYSYLVCPKPKVVGPGEMGSLASRKTRTTGSAGTGSFGSFARSWIHRLDVCCVGICFSGLFIFRLAFRPGLRLGLGFWKRQYVVSLIMLWIWLEAYPMEELFHCVICILMFKGSSSFYPWSFWINRFRCGRWQQTILCLFSEWLRLEWVRGRGILRTRICELVRNGTCWLDRKEARWWLLVENSLRDDCLAFPTHLPFLGHFCHFLLFHGRSFIFPEYLLYL